MAYMMPKHVGMIWLFIYIYQWCTCWC